MQSTMLSKLHVSHAGAASNLRLAKEFMFWPGMASAIENICSSCGICAQYPRSSSVEPMKSVPIPEGPYELLSQDLFQFEGVSYLVTVCHWSDWIECDELPDTLSTTVVKATRKHVSRFGRPKYVLTDNGLQFVSKEYQRFASQYDFSHITASPYYPRGNGKAESAVKINKNMLRKCEDFDLAMLLYRNTPQQGYVYSPAQRLLGHKTRTTLSVAQPSTHSSGVDPKVIRQDLLHRRAKAKEAYDHRSSGPSDSLALGEHAYAKPPPVRKGEPWEFGTIVDLPGPNSYVIKTSGGKMIRRNR